MQTITDEHLAWRVTRLPAWAQAVIYGLDQQLTEARAQIARLSAGPDGSNVRVHDYGGNPDRLLGRDVPVCFDLPSGTVEVHHSEPGVLDITATGSNAIHYPHITPSCANTFRLRLGEY